MTDAERFEAALAADDPIEELRSVAIAFGQAGLLRSQILDRFLPFYLVLQEQGREREEQVLGDVMDMIAGYFCGFNLDLPDDSV